MEWGVNCKNHLIFAACNDRNFNWLEHEEEKTNLILLKIDRKLNKYMNTSAEVVRRCSDLTLWNRERLRSQQSEI
jgi:hypothetical protein